MADLGPSKKRITQLLCMLGSNGGERSNAFAALERTMQSAGVSWSDIGNAVARDDGKFTEDELQEYGNAVRAEGVEEGIRLGLARANTNGSRNGHLVLPKPAKMAEFSSQRQAYLRTDREREFVNEMAAATQHGRRLTPRMLGYLASLYIGVGGKT